LRDVGPELPTFYTEFLSAIANIAWPGSKYYARMGHKHDHKNEKGEKVKCIHEGYKK
jgi:hypothetical protein